MSGAAGGGSCTDPLKGPGTLRPDTQVRTHWTGELSHGGSELERGALGVSSPPPPHRPIPQMEKLSLGSLRPGQSYDFNTSLPLCLISVAGPTTRKQRLQEGTQS